ncbi:putative mitochondrion protein [Naematelia encephala]|uniref:Cytochrome c oxidase assembly factor 3 n=1 Tax=Naematelia encephala TaxID=71784 RepID=A0A1Y2AYP0_9TREE|nr:putative mitochondrion protein [Naematelia encephala]
MSSGSSSSVRAPAPPPMELRRHLTIRERDRTYRPGGTGMSESLRRARRPYLIRNAITGVVLASFVIGVYAYSISAVKQDDFSDVEDLLPPLAERSQIRTIEDEARDALLAQEGAGTATPLSPLPLSTNIHPPSSIRSLVPRRLSEIEWVRKRGWVDQSGNVLVWGAPPVDNVGKIGDRTDH